MKVCTGCNKKKPLKDFDNKKREDGKMGKKAKCKDCSREVLNLWRKENPEKVKKQKQRSDTKYKKANRQKMRDYEKARRKKYRLEAFHAYGGAFCVCCGESAYEFLSLDHINGGGTKHRKEVHGKGDFVYLLRKDGWPEGYRVLCHNCNQAMGYYGYCPHQKDNNV